MRYQRLVFLLMLPVLAAGPCWAKGPAAVQADSLRSAAAAHMRDGQNPAAVAALKALTETGQARAEDWVHLGQANLAAGDLRAARKAFNKAVKKGARAEGYNGIGLVYQRMGGNQNEHEARNYFRRALHRDPSFAEAEYNLGTTYRNPRSSQALKAFKKTVEIDPRHPDAYYREGLVLEAKGDSLAALEAYRKQISVNPRHGRAAYREGMLLLDMGQRKDAVHLFVEAAQTPGGMQAFRELAVLSQQAGDFKHAQSYFETYIRSLPGADQRRFKDISLVASRKELALYQALPDSEKADAIRRFWNRHDPTPLTAVNERLVEHYRRVAYALDHYGLGNGQWDARGDVYVRLGTPAHVSRWNDVQAEMNPDIQNARTNFVNRFHIGLPIQPGLPIFPVAPNARWEYWVYPNINGGTEITFVKNFGGKGYEFASLPVGMPLSLGTDLMKMQSNVLVRNIARREASIYQPTFANLPIDFSYYPAGFRGPDGKTHLEIYYGLPAVEVARLKVDKKTHMMVLDRGVALFDSLWNEVYLVKGQIAFQPPSDKQIQEGAFIPGVLQTNLPPGPFHMAMQVRDVVSGKSQVYQQDIRLADYSVGQNLEMSDIELAFSISEADSGGEFVKHGLRVIPMSSRSFQTNQHAFLYFEIYNLERDKFGQTHYRVEYRVSSDKKRSAPTKVLHGVGRLFRLTSKDEEVAVSYEQTGTKPAERSYVELDLSQTRAGRQRVEVTVTDLQTHQQVSRETWFKIVPR